ncbi:DUF262 domain-containing protein [Solwaraspora sp. WMMD406]|uniref:DUF262 domain-containing protein n=1 Tax=Solwaraspora sp. WMMD406 TaxID=3016095 RepID=UPI002416A234|nr:DUF262 domain-containing protein [Solwaraspora sp. WMMD406]MDG4764422.1 DUF262 domain-containing protein [Solwaraspora sp. WMMD406]
MTSIRQLIAGISEGRVRIPAFQRGFVWDPDRVAQLMDSIYKGYPFGALLFWRTKNTLRTERDLGPFVLPARPEDYPVDYVLDGQQRLTSIFGVFQTELAPVGDAAWTNIYFDYRTSSDVQESSFVSLAPDEVDPERHFPLSVLFDAPQYGAAFRRLSEEVVPVIDEMHSRFKETVIPIQTFTTDDRAGVAIVFERVNRLGVELDTLQLLSAWTWSDDFDLQGKFAELSEELAPFGFRDVGEEVTLLLRCCAAIVEGDASPKTMVSLNGTKVREQFPLVVNGLKGAIDFVRKELNVEKLDNLPYSSLLVPLAVFFASESSKSVPYTDGQRRQLLRWIWKSCWSLRYGRQVTRSLEVDIAEIVRMKSGLASRLDDFAVHLDDRTFLENRFNLNTVITKTFVLMLAQAHPRSLVSGQSVDLSEVLRSYNRNEFHHLYPQAFLRSRQVSAENHSYLANMCFISSIDNKVLGGRAPSVYKPDVAKDPDVLARAFCPDRELWDDNYSDFVRARANLLCKEAQRQMTQ